MEPLAAGRFFVIFWNKKTILTSLDHISHVFRAIEKNYIFNIWKPIVEWKNWTEKIELFNLFSSNE